MTDKTKVSRVIVVDTKPEIKFEAGTVYQNVHNGNFYLCVFDPNTDTTVLTTLQTPRPVVCGFTQEDRYDFIEVSKKFVVAFNAH